MDTIKPRYKVVFENGIYGILGTEETTGEVITIKRISCDKKSTEMIAEMLNEKSVSIFHARDVILDYFIAAFTE